MKKLLSSLLLVLCLTNAEAGVLLGSSFGIGGLLSESDDSGKILGLGIASGVIVGAVFGGRAIIQAAQGNPWGISAGVLVMVLDHQGSNHYLAEKFPFLDNQIIVQKLTNLLFEKFETQKNDEGIALIILDSTEVEEILAPLDLTQEQLNLVLNGLSRNS